jgi:hypothetical protein
LIDEIGKWRIWLDRTEVICCAIGLTEMGALRLCRHWHELLLNGFGARVEHDPLPMSSFREPPRFHRILWMSNKIPINGCRAPCCPYYHWHENLGGTTGPSGLSLPMDLAMRRIRCALKAEERYRLHGGHSVKCCAASIPDAVIAKRRLVPAPASSEGAS